MANTIHIIDSGRSVCHGGATFSIPRTGNTTGRKYKVYCFGSQAQANQLGERLGDLWNDYGYYADWVAADGISIFTSSGVVTLYGNAFDQSSGNTLFYSSGSLPIPTNHYYSFSAPSGATQFDSIGDAHLQPLNPSLDSSVGFFGSGLKITATNQKMIGPALGITSGTYNLWIRMPSNNAGHKVICGQSGIFDLAAYYNWIGYHQYGLDIRLSQFRINTGRWHMATLVFASGGDNQFLCRFYLDGTYRFAHWGKTQAVGPVFVGATSNYVALPSEIDEFFISDKHLSDVEIAQLYNRGDGLEYPFTNIRPQLISTSGYTTYFSCSDRSTEHTESDAPPCLIYDQVTRDAARMQLSPAGRAALPYYFNKILNYGIYSKPGVSGGFDYIQSTASGNVVVGDIDFCQHVWLFASSLKPRQIIVTNYVPSIDALGYSLEQDNTDIKLRFRDLNQVNREVAVTGIVTLGNLYWIYWQYSSGNKQVTLKVNNQYTAQTSTTGIWPAFSGIRILYNGASSGYCESPITHLGIARGRLLTAEEQTIMFNNFSGLAYPFV